MSLNILLPYGYVAVYGTGYTPGINGTVGPRGYTFGQIYQIANHEINQAEVGQSVLFKVTDQTTIFLATVPYQILPEAKIVITETVPL